MRKDVREFIRRLDAAGLTVEPTPGHYRVLHNGKPLRKANGMPFTLPFSTAAILWSLFDSIGQRRGDPQTPSSYADSPCIAASRPCSAWAPTRTGVIRSISFNIM